MEHDASDILGQNTMPSPSGAGSGLFSLSTTQSIYTAIALGGFLYIGLRLWKRVMVWRERSYKLATRRRHGIPDTDLRPFNVAYSEAVMRAREEENQRHPKSRPAPRPQPSFVDLRESSQEDSVLRNRSGIPQRPDTGMRSTAVPVPGGYYPTPSDPSHLRIGSVINEIHPYVDQTGKETNGQFSHAPAHTKKAPGLTRQRGYFNVDDADDSEDKKRTFDDDIDEEHESKKTRVDGDELMDGDDDAEFEEEAPRRGSKRGLREDVDESLAKAARGKRARKVSAEKPLHPDSSMDVDLEDEEADEVPEMSPVRGKKRDRAEAGSTFGGDDEEDEQESAKASRRRIKRRTVSKRKSETGVLRGKKRDRAGSAEASEASGSSPDNKRSSRAKRGKRTSHGGSGVHHHHHRDQDDRAARSDVSMDESTTSNRSKVRSVGDEWESNGVKYKIGPNYQRLRQALVKKARQKFLMPKDSQHPDRSENLQVCIETWLTEEEYQEAKRQHMLAWQDDSPKSRRPEQGDKLTIDVSQANGSSHQAGTNVPGKSLLWGRSTTTTPTMSPAPTSPTSEAGAMTLDKLQAHTLAQTPAKEHRYGRHSLAGSAVGLPAGTFASQIPTAKRIASASRAWNLGANGSAFDAADHVGAGGVSSTPSTASPVVGLSDSTNTSMNGANGTGSALAISVAVGSPRASPVKVFSKWEKQELEARAMMKIREANRRKEMERDAEEREARERAEREKAERERMEREARERVERERAAKAEAERKAREEEEKRKAAAAASTAASANAAATAAAPGTGTTSSLAGAPPLGSQSTLSGAAPTSSTAAPASSGTGGFGFFPPGGAASSSGSTTAAAAASPFGAPKPPAATTTSTSTPGNPFGLPTGNGTTTESNKPASAFSFGPAPTSTTSATNGSTAPKANAFSFGPSEPKEESSTASTTNGGASLLSRLGSTAPTTTSDPAKPASNPMFSFNTTAKQDGGASSSASSNPFGAPTSSSSSAGAGATSTPKFNFGFGGAKTTAAPSTSTTSTSPTSGSTASSSLSGALGSDAAKTNPFGMFKTPGMPASGNGTAASGTTSGGATVPKFSFGGTGGGAGGSAFGGSSNNTSSSSSSNVFGGGGATNAFGGGSSNVFGGGGSTNAFSGGAGKEPVKSAFGNTGGGSGGSVFGSTSGMGAQAAASPSPFGAPSSSSQTQNVFGGGATAGKEEPKKPLFSFNTGASSGSSATNTTTTPAAGGAGKFSFNFGGGGSSASTSAAGAAASPFGAAPGGSGGSVFGGGAFGSAASQQK